MDVPVHTHTMKMPLSRCSTGFPSLLLMIAVVVMVLEVAVMVSGYDTVLDDAVWLQQLFISTNGQNWKSTCSQGWNLTAGAVPCDNGRSSWSNVVCNASNNRVLMIILLDCALTGTLPELSDSGALSKLVNMNLHFNRIGGTLPSSWSRLPSLKYMYVFDTDVTGPLPDTWGALNTVLEMNLRYNQLSGTLPPSWSNLTLVTTMDLRANQLRGSLPPAWGPLLSNLQVLQLSANQLNGTIPEAWGSFAQLEVMVLFGNALTGTIPHTLGQQLAYLTNLSLYNNQLTGSIPESVGSLSNLLELNLQFNRLDGTIPMSLCALTSLTVLYLMNNQLSGSIPGCLGSGAFRLRAVVMSGNQLNGTVPAALGSLSQLQSLLLDSNHFSGTIPPELGNATQITILNVSNNKLEGTLPDALSKLTVLAILNVSRNHLQGTLPSVYSRLQTLLFFFASDNYLEGDLPLKWPAAPIPLCDTDDFICYQFVVAVTRASGVPLTSFGRIVGVQLQGNCFPTSSMTPTSPNISWWRRKSADGATLIAQRNASECAPYTAKPQQPVTPTTLWNATAIYQRPPVPTALSVATMVVMAAGGVVSSGAAGGVMSGLLPLMMQRVTMALGGASDALYTATSLSWTDSPLQWRIGPSSIDGGVHRGAVVGNLCLCAGIAAIWLVAVSIGCLVFQKQKKHRGRGLQVLVSVVLDAAGFPGSIVASVCLPLFQPTLQSSVVLIIGGFDVDRSRTEAAGWRDAEVSIGVVGLVVSTCVWLLVAVRLDPRTPRSAEPLWFAAQYRPTRAARLSTTSWAGEGNGFLRRLLEGCEPVSVWRDVARPTTSSRKYHSRHQRREGGGSFVARYGALFEGSRRYRHWWTTCEISLSTLLVAITIAWSRHQAGYDGDVWPVAWSWVTSVVLCGWMFLHLFASPFRSRIEHLIATVLAALSCAASVMQAVSVDDGGVPADGAAAITAAAIVASLLGAVLPTVARIIVARMLQQSGALLDELTQRSGLRVSPLIRCFLSANSTSNLQPQRQQQRVSDISIIPHQQQVPTPQVEHFVVRKHIPASRVALLDHIQLTGRRRSRRGMVLSRRGATLQRLVEMICSTRVAWECLTRSTLRREMWTCNRN